MMGPEKHHKLLLKYVEGNVKMPNYNTKCRPSAEAFDLDKKLKPFCITQEFFHLAADDCG